ncbi:MAG: MFS transporter, partial [Pseudomonadota bacterium]
MDKTAGEMSPESLRHAWYVVFVCMVAYVFSFIDRQILALLIGPIRADLNITDTQFSLLQGFAFSLFYAIMGVPIARMSDRHSRPLIIAVGIALWSAATAASGLAKSFMQLFIARMTVGFGEAALSPATYSMIRDLFPQAQLGRALGVYSVGSFIGAGLAFLIGGQVIALVSQMDVVSLPMLGEIRPWQLVFFVVGLPGLAVALLVYLTIEDPPRKGLRRAADGSVEEVKFTAVLAFIREHWRTFFFHFAGFSFSATIFFALLSWAPAYYMRVHELT